MNLLKLFVNFRPFAFISYMQYLSTATTDKYATITTTKMIERIKRGLYKGLFATFLEIVDTLRNLLETTSVTISSTVVVLGTSDVTLGKALVFISASNLIYKI